MRLAKCGVLLMLAGLFETPAWSATLSPGPDTPVSEAEFARILEYYQYDSALPLEARVSPAWPWRGPQVTFRVTYAGAHGLRVPAYLAIPKQRKKAGRLPAVILLHGSNDFWGKNGDWAFPWISLLTGAGYVVLVPDHYLYGERAPDTGAPYDPLNASSCLTREWITQDVIDYRRAIDYLESRPEVDRERIGIFGGSLGGWVGSILAAVDGRIKAAILSVPACETTTSQSPAGRVANAVNFYPRLKPSSVLMVLAEKDRPARNRRDRMLFTLIPGEKDLIVYASGHYMPPENYHAEILDWLHKHLNSSIRADVER